MNRGDDVSNDAGEPAVRVLAPDGYPVEPGVSSSSMRRWLLPIGAVIGLLALFFGVTGPSDTATGATTTTSQTPPISAVEPETFDLRTASDSELTDGWRSMPFDDSATVADLIYADGVYLAGGASSDGAQVWWTHTGYDWSSTTTIDRPDASSAIQYIVPWKDGFVAIGSERFINNQVDIWTTTRPKESWEYHGRLEPDSGPAIGLAATSQLLALTEGEAGWMGWTSSDGVEWAPRELAGLANALLQGLTSDGDAFYAYGRSLEGSVPLPAIYRSEDGISWQEVLQAEFPSISTVSDIGVADGRMVAVGYTTSDESQSMIPLWETNDGVEWKRIAVDDPAILAQSVSFTVTGTTPGDYPTADLQVDTTTVTLTEGTTLDTDFGSVVVETIIDNGIEIRGDGFSEFLATHRTYFYPGDFIPMKVAVEGPRIAVVGDAYGMSEPQPYIWTSMDFGKTWERNPLPAPRARAYQIVTEGDYLTLIASGGSDTSVWRARWNNDSLETSAVNAVSDLVSVINAHNAAAVVRALPAHITGLPTFEVPSLGHEDPAWWDGAGDLDLERVDDTIGYLAATNTDITINECEATVTLGSSDRADVVCLYTVNSDLLRLFGVVDGKGRLAATVRDGALLEISIESSPSQTMWDTLAPRLMADSPDGISFSAATAQEHLEGARLYLEGLLQPGETTIVDTALGTMEWTWIAPDELSPVYESSVVWSQLGFTWFGSTESATTGIEPFVYNSTDGTTWEEAPVPDGATSLWQMHAFQDGLIGSMWNSAGMELVYFDGSTWTPIPVPVEDPANAYFSVVTGTDTALLEVTEWSDAGITTNAVYMIDSELNLTGASEPPATADSPYPNVQFTPSDNGFVAIVTDMGTGSISVWVTATGQEWTLLTEKLALDNVGAIWSLQGHNGQYFVVGEGAELRCTDTTLGDECGFWLTVWDSPDGQEWHELRTTDGGLVTTSQIASGPLGLAAFGTRSPTGSASAVYVSADGSEWEEVEHLALMNTADTSWWDSAPAVGNDTIVLTGIIYSQSVTLDPDIYEGSDGQAFMIVGRLVDQ